MAHVMDNMPLLYDISDETAVELWMTLHNRVNMLDPRVVLNADVLSPSERALYDALTAMFTERAKTQR